MSESNQSPEDFFNGLLGQAMKQQAKQQAMIGFVQSISGCMEQEGVNLEAAIVMAKELFDADTEINRAQIENTPEFDPAALAEADAAIHDAFDQAVRKMRQVVTEAYKIVRLDSTGSSTPKPYNLRGHLEEKARQADAEAAFKQFFGNGS